MASDGYARRWNSVEYDASSERLMDSPLLMPGAAGEPFSARAGRRVGGSGLAVTISTGPDTANVSAGSGVIYDSANASLGPWLFEIPTAKALVMPARPGSGTSRIDLIVARIYDADSGVGAVREVKIERVAGTASASPSAPSLPALSLELARLTVPASGSITVTPSTSRTVAAGGILPVTTTALRNALPSPYKGLAVYNEQTGKLEIYNGTSWDTVGPASAGVDTGWVNLTIASGYTTGGSRTPQIRLKNGQVKCRGQIGKSSGSFPASAATQIASMPDPMFYPPDGPSFGVGNSGSGPDARITIGTGGQIQIVTGSTVPSTWVALDDVDYWLD